MRHEVKSGGGTSWLGIKTGKLESVRDESSKYAWADVYLVCEFSVEGSKYPRPLKIAGSWEKNADGTIQDGTLLKRITFLFDALGFQGGVNQFGEWVDENEEKINDICDYLELGYKGSDCTIYVYRELAKDGKAYTRIHNKVLKAGNGSAQELEGYINYLKANNFIKEAPADHDNNSTVAADPIQVDGVDIATL